jgi:hypothetical protein
VYSISIANPARPRVTVGNFGIIIVTCLIKIDYKIIIMEILRTGKAALLILLKGKPETV